MYEGKLPLNLVIRLILFYLFKRHFAFFWVVSVFRLLSLVSSFPSPLSLHAQVLELFKEDRFDLVLRQIDCLLALGANVDGVDANGFTPIDLAAAQSLVS